MRIGGNRLRVREELRVVGQARVVPLTFEGGAENHARRSGAAGFGLEEDFRSRPGHVDAATLGDGDRVFTRTVFHRNPPGEKDLNECKPNVPKRKVPSATLVALG